MRMYDMIMKKRQGMAHTREEIEYIVKGFTDGEIPDYQMSAWLMCVYYKGMTRQETVWLTLAMADSGDRLDLSSIEGLKVDKHSTGGVGDKTTLIIAPILASLGVPIAKMSGRGLGHTGGTIDKLESIPGFCVDIPEKQFVENVNKHKLALVSQTGNLAPADKKIYALRDVTASVDSLPLIASSIMSKKLAAGADVIVLDVKCGSGAFMKKREEAVELAQLMVDIGIMSGHETYAIITDMNEPLGCKVGNSLEVQEAIEVLSLKKYDDIPYGIQRLVKVSLELAGYMLMGAKKAATPEEAGNLCAEAITSGKALDKLAEFVAAQGGDARYIYDPGLFSGTRYVIPVCLGKSGYIASCDTSEVGMACLALGGGRTTKESSINLNVGLDIKKNIGDYVAADEPIAYIHSDDDKTSEEAKNRLINAYKVAAEPVCREDIIKDIIMNGGL